MMENFRERWKGFFTMPEEEFRAKHKSYFMIIHTLEKQTGKNTVDYKQAFGRWFILREVGVLREFWGFIPTLKELKELLL